MPAHDDADHLLDGLCSLWLSKIRKAIEHKKKVFQDDADAAMQFYRPRDGDYRFIYSEAVKDGMTEPNWKMTLNKVVELVEIFGPILYAKNPIRQVNPRQPVQLPPELMGPDPYTAQAAIQQEQMRLLFDGAKAMLLATYLNYTPNELRLKDHAERAIDEALIKGRGTIWTELYTPPESGTRMIGSFYDTVDSLFVDPDAECFEDAYWIARRCCHPVWEVEREYGLAPGTLKGNREGMNQQADVDATKGEFDRQRGLTNDLLAYYKIYSKMGAGGRLSGSDKSGQRGPLPGDLQTYNEVFDKIVGDHVYLVVAEGTDYPLNLPPAVQGMSMSGDGSPQDGLTQIQSRMAWPIPYWADKAWPVSVLDFHPVPRSAWPMSHIKPAMGELRFLNWAYSFVMGKIRNTCRDIVAVLKEMGDQFKIQVLEGMDLSMVELDTQNRDIKEAVQVLQFPQMNADIWRVIEAVENNFEKRVGLNEIYYGKSDKQIRSATEADLKSQHLNIRPDDMAERTESWMTEVARKEAIACRWLLGPADVAPVLGPVGAQQWGQMVASRDMSIFRELEYRVEAGSTRKPNKDRDLDNANQAVQTLLPVLQGFAQATGQMGPINALIAFWAKSRDLPPDAFLLPAAPPPPPMAGPPSEPAALPPPGA